MLKPSKKMMKYVKHVWENRDDGTHAWYKHYNGYITVECFSDNFCNNSYYDYILVTECNEIDSLGYPLDVVDVLTFEEKDILQ